MTSTDRLQQYHSTSQPSYDDSKYNEELTNKLKDMLVPVDMQEGAGGEGVRLDLQTLLKVLDQQTTDEEVGTGANTFHLVIIQAILLVILVSVSVVWACCCKRRCFKNNNAPRVQEALRKLSSQSLKSRDYPPSYSQADLHTLAMSVHDYLYPPPDYPEVFNRSADDLAYLDLEAGHRRLSRLSFSNPNTPPPSYHGSPRQQSSSNVKLPLSPKNSVGSAVLPGIAGHQQLSRQSTWSSISSSDSRRSSFGHSRSDSLSHSRKSSLKDPASRKSSNQQDSRRGSQSRISFNEAVECSNGSFRRLSGPQDHIQVSRQSSTNSLPILSRQSSSNSLPHLSRQGSNSSLPTFNLETHKKSILLASRKLGLSQESLNEELMKRLEAIDHAEDDTYVEDDQLDIEVEKHRNSLETIIEVEKH